MSKAFFDAARKIAGGSLDQTQVDSINAIMANCILEGVTDPILQGYILGTAWHEARLRPIEEVGKGKGKPYGQPAGPYGHRYYGRGLVQLTWHVNYKASSKDAGVDLEKFPEKALDPEIASRLIVIGMMDGRWNGRRKGLAEYLGNGKRDYKNARRTVNITDRWELIKGHSLKFTAALEQHGFETVKPTKPRKEFTMWSLIATVASTFLGGLFPGGKKGTPGTNIFRSILGLFTGTAVGEKSGVLDLSALFGAGTGMANMDWTTILLTVVLALFGNTGIETVIQKMPAADKKEPPASK